MISIIFNPVAGGRGRGMKLYEQLLAFVEQHSIDAEVVKTIAPGDGQHLANVALKKGREHVVAVGGDGTVHEILNGIEGQGATLGIVPTGTINSIARGLELPMDWQKALPIALRGGAREVDVGVAGDRAFLGTAGLGLEVEQMGMPVPASTVQRLSPERAQELRLTFDGSMRLEAPFYAAAVAVTALRAGYVRTALPIADDGRMELAVLSPGPDGPETTRFRCTSIELVAPPDLALHLDGEVRRSASPLAIRIAAQRQRVLVSGAEGG